MKKVSELQASAMGNFTLYVKYLPVDIFPLSREFCEKVYLVLKKRTMTEGDWGALSKINANFSQKDAEAAENYAQDVIDFLVGRERANLTKISQIPMNGRVINVSNIKNSIHYYFENNYKLVVDTEKRTVSDVGVYDFNRFYFLPENEDIDAHMKRYAGAEIPVRVFDFQYSYHWANVFGDKLKETFTLSLNKGSNLFITPSGVGIPIGTECWRIAKTLFHTNGASIVITAEEIQSAFVKDVLDSLSQDFK
jgi:hypothetical protein